MTTTTTRRRSGAQSPRKQTAAQARTSALRSDLTPIYAAAGLTSAVARTVRSTAAHTTDRVGQRLAELQRKPAEMEATAKRSASGLGARVRSLPQQAKTLPDQTRTRIEAAQTQVRTTYVKLAGRGKQIVDEALVEVTEAVDPALERVQEGVTVARQRITGHTATESMTPGSSVEAANTRATNTKKAPAKKAATKLRADRAQLR